MPCYFIETLSNRVVDSITLAGSVGGLHASGYYNASTAFTGAMAAALVYRDNHVDNGQWSVNGAVTDVLIEGNTSKHIDLRNRYHNMMCREICVVS